MDDDDRRRTIAEAATSELWALSHAVRPIDPEPLAARIAERLEPMIEVDRDAVQDLVELWLMNELDRVFDRNWEPTDLNHLVGVRLDQTTRVLLLHLVRRAVVVRLDARRRPSASRWLDEVTALIDEVGARPMTDDESVLARLGREGTVDRAVLWARSSELLRTLFRLPALPPLSAASGPADAADAPEGLVDRKLLDRVRGLLSKAESTTFPEEADALTAKAQELMARNAIDQAMVEGDPTVGAAGAPASRRIWIDNPYADGKSLLLNNVATANRCRAVFFRSLSFMTLVGYPADLDAVDLLFTSLLVQADTAIREAGSQVDRAGRSRTRSFRASFWVAFAHRIGDRLAEAVATTVHDAEADHGDALLPVLASRSERVEAHVDELFPDATPHGVVASNGAGWRAGTEAADRADIGLRRPIRSAT